MTLLRCWPGWDVKYLFEFNDALLAGERECFLRIETELFLAAFRHCLHQIRFGNVELCFSHCALLCLQLVFGFVADALARLHIQAALVQATVHDDLACLIVHKRHFTALNDCSKKKAVL